MTKHVVWAEIRCDLQSGVGCLQGRDIGWISGAQQIKAAIKQAGTEGWDVSGHKTICPMCKAGATRDDNPEFWRHV